MEKNHYTILFLDVFSTKKILLSHEDKKKDMPQRCSFLSFYLSTKTEIIYILDRNFGVERKYLFGPEKEILFSYEIMHFSIVLICNIKNYFLNTFFLHI